MKYCELCLAKYTTELPASSVVCFAKHNSQYPMRHYQKRCTGQGASKFSKFGGVVALS